MKLFHFNFHTVSCCDVFLLPYGQVILHISHRIPTEDLWHVHEDAKIFRWASLQNGNNILKPYWVKYERSKKGKLIAFVRLSFQFPNSIFQQCPDVHIKHLWKAFSKAKVVILMCDTWDPIIICGVLVHVSSRWLGGLETTHQRPCLYRKMKKQL